jgi:hypothetical protein
LHEHDDGKRGNLVSGTIEVEVEARIWSRFVNEICLDRHGRVRWQGIYEVRGGSAGIENEAESGKSGPDHRSIDDQFPYSFGADGRVKLRDRERTGLETCSTEDLFYLEFSWYMLESMRLQKKAGWKDLGEDSCRQWNRR